MDVFGGAFFMLSRYEEFVVADRDRYGRFAGTSSIAHREGFLGCHSSTPTWSLLELALEHLWPRLPRPAQHFRVALSHDVDRPLASVGAELRLSSRASSVPMPSSAATPGSPSAGALLGRDAPW